MWRDTPVLPWLKSLIDDWERLYTFYGLVQDCSISIANAMEILQPCTKPLPLCHGCIISSAWATEMSPSCIKPVWQKGLTDVMLLKWISGLQHLIEVEEADWCEDIHLCYLDLSHSLMIAKGVVSMAWCKTAVSLLHLQWRYCSLAPSHWLYTMAALYQMHEQQRCHHLALNQYDRRALLM